MRLLFFLILSFTRVPNISASITYRIAVGPQQGRKVFA